MLRPAARGAGAISGNGRQQCLDFWVDRMLRFRTRQGRLLRRKRPTFVTHFNREDGRPLVIQSGRYPSGDSRRHQKILQFGMAGSLAGVPPYGICWCGPHACIFSVRSNGSRSSHQRFRCVALIASLPMSRSREVFNFLEKSVLELGTNPFRVLVDLTDILLCGDCSLYYFGRSVGSNHMETFYAPCSECVRKTTSRDFTSGRLLGR